MALMTVEQQATLFETAPFPPYSRSPSRHRTFSECRRRYFHRYYGAHNGWTAEASEAARRTYVLKKMVTLAQLVGTRVHEAIERAIRFFAGTGRDPDAAWLFEGVRGRLNQDWLESRRRLWDPAALGPADATNLLEHYYGKEVLRERIDVLRGRVRRCLEAFLRSRAFERIRAAAKGSWRGCEELHAFDVEGVPVYAKPDFALVEGDRLVVFDWKTGGGAGGGDCAAANDEQIAFYALFAEKVFGFPPDRVRAWLVYLDSGTEREVPVTDEIVGRARALLGESVARMRAQAVGADAVRNEPLPREAFPLVSDRRACAWCPFLELCRDELAATAAPDAPA